MSDKGIKVIGYQVFFEDLRQGMFMFNHTCNTTIAIKTDVFMDLYQGPVYTRRNPSGNKCPGKCLNKNMMSPCSDDCRCAFVSHIMTKIQEWNPL